MLGKTTKLSVPFQVLGLLLHLKVIFFGLTEISIKKSLGTRLKKQKDVGMACQEGRDEIIVKVNLQSPIPTSFYITVAKLV